MFQQHPDGWIQVTSPQGKTDLIPLTVFQTLEPAYHMPMGYYMQYYTQTPARRVLSNGRDEKIIRGEWPEGDIYISKVLDYIMATIPVEPEEPPTIPETTHDN